MQDELQDKIDKDLKDAAQKFLQALMKMSLPVYAPVRAISMRCWINSPKLNDNRES